LLKALESICASLFRGSYDDCVGKQHTTS